MDSSQPFFATCWDAKDGISSGGSWGLPILDDSLLHELTGFNRADDSMPHARGCAVPTLTRAAVQNSIDCLSLQLSTSSLADVQDFLLATDPLFLNDGPSTIASNTQASASNYAVDRSFSHDPTAKRDDNPKKSASDLKQAAAQVASRRDVECGYRSAAQSRKQTDIQKSSKSVQQNQQTHARFSLSVPETACFFQEISRVNLVSRRESGATSNAAAFTAPLTRPSVHSENFEYLVVASADWGALGRSGKTSGWLVHRDGALGLDIACSFDLPGAAVAVEWCSSSTIVSACGDVISLVTFDENGGNPTTVSVPAFHRGAIRDLAAVPPTGLVLTCANDGCCFIFDASRLKSDMALSVEKSCISCLSVGHALSSVGWRTESTVSATTDSGLCALFDIRGDSDSTLILGHTQHTGAASHTWLDYNTVCLGMQDGGLQIYDVRRPDTIMLAAADATCSTISDVEHLNGCLAVIGEPGFSVWQFNGSGLTLKASFEQPSCIGQGRLGSCFAGTLLPMKGTAAGVNVLCCSGEGVLKDIQVTF